MIKKSSSGNASFPLKKDLMNEFGLGASGEIEGGYILGSAQDCETDEDESGSATGNSEQLLSGERKQKEIIQT